MKLDRTTPKVRRGAQTSRAGWLLFLLPALALGQVGGSAPPPSQDEQGVSEHFLIEWVGNTPHPSQGYRGIKGLELALREGQLGLVEFHRRRVAGGWQLEQEVNFPFDQVRLMAVECLSARSPRLVWREICASGGRTIFAEWTAESERLKVVEWGVDGSLRESLSTSRGAVMPQYLLELARTGQIVGGRFEVFDPLRGELDEWTLELAYLRVDGDQSANPAAYRRRLEFRRRDGSLAGRYLFEGGRLESFQWQEGQVRARRISAELFAQLEQRWRPEEAPEEPPGGLPGVKDL